jgi:transcriptional regulator with XRE-family HTH domain
MNFGYRVMSWRRNRGWTQADLAARSNLTRPYLSKVEKGSADPALSVVRRLAAALGISIGQLTDEAPPERSLSREEMDRLARGALHPGTREAQSLPETRVLARLIGERRKALGFWVPRKKPDQSSAHGSPGSVHASLWLRASLGERQWNALLRRIDKLAAVPREKP